MTVRHALPWQLILADLALILFLVSLAALAGLRANNIETQGSRDISVAAAQTLFRPSEDGVDISEWLATQDIDPRATLTVFARYSSADQAKSWRQAERLAEAARAIDVPVRVVLTPAERSDTYASLAFDAPR